MKRLYGIRGAITAENNKESITEKTIEMCSLIFNENRHLKILILCKNRHQRQFLMKISFCQKILSLCILL